MEGSQSTCVARAATSPKLQLRTDVIPTLIRLASRSWKCLCWHDIAAVIKIEQSRKKKRVKGDD